MVGNNKILTVSYGTFSCTLEGFDDPFSTMRSIAEYFRDLAADDRYFGAEPPTPDVEMLHRLAERDARRRVESRVEGNGVVLRPAREQMDDAEPAETASTQLAAPAVLAAPALGEAVEDGISEKLQRIRAAVARSAGEPAAADTYAEDDEADAFVPPAETIESAFADVAPTAPEPETPTPESAPLAEAAEDSLAAPTTEPAPEPPAETARTDDVPQMDDAPEAEAAAEPEVEPEPDALAQMLEAARADEETSAKAPEPMVAEAAPVAPPAPAPAEDDDIFDLDSLEVDTLFGDTDLEEPGDEPSDLADDLNETLAADIAAASASAQDEDDHDGDAPIAAPLRLTPDQQAAATPPQVRARVVKMRREDFEAAFEPDGDAEAAPEDGETVPQDDTDQITTRLRDELGDTGLSPEDEADLLAELAAAERNDPEPMRHQAAEPVADPEMAGRPRRVMPASDASVDRILEQTNTELESTDGNRRRSAIAHLKAAVAAIRADGGARGNGNDKEMGRYRADLARVVRPERPVPQAEARGSAAQAPRKMPPLMLVSEQRVDQPQTAETAAIQPRRVQRDATALAMQPEPEDMPDMAVQQPALVAAPVLAETVRETLLSDFEGSEEAGDGANFFAESSAFGDFVEDHDLDTLTDLLEASAAFGAEVEGLEESSRADIIKRVKDVLPDAVDSREETLRAFGTILREGRLKKLRRGFFTISETSRFQPDRRSSATG